MTLRTVAALNCSAWLREIEREETGSPVSIKARTTSVRISECRRSIIWDIAQRHGPVRATRFPVAHSQEARQGFETSQNHFRGVRRERQLGRHGGIRIANTHRAFGVVRLGAR